MKNKAVKVSVDNLIPGLYVDLKLSWKDHPFLFGKFKIRSQQEIAVIKGLGLKTVTVYPGRSDIKMPQANSQESDPPADDQDDAAIKDKLWEQKKAKVEKAGYYRLRRQRVYHRYSESAKRVKNFTNNLQTAPANAIRDAEEVIEDMASAFEKEDSVLMNLVNLSASDYSLYHHALNVTILSLSLGRALGFHQESLRQLGMGAILHDVGKIMVPGKVLHKKTPLTPSEQGILESHPILGSRLTQRVQSLSQATIEVIERHHEMRDGSGYPNHLKDDAVPVHAQIVAVANLYDNLCNPPNNQRAATPKEALAMLYAKYRNRFETYVVETFVRTMGIYPPGCVVRLSDDSLGLVVAIDPQALLQPTVLLYNPDIPRTEALMVNLIEHPELTVTSVLRPGEYPARIYDYLGIEERIGYFFEDRT